MLQLFNHLKRPGVSFLSLGHIARGSKPGGEAAARRAKTLLQRDVPWLPPHEILEYVDALPKTGTGLRTRPKSAPSFQALRGPFGPQEVAGIPALQFVTELHREPRHGFAAV